MKILGVAVKKWNLTLTGRIYIVDNVDDFVSVDIDKHVNVLLPKFIRLMIENKRTEESIRAILGLYAYYSTILMANVHTFPQTTNRENFHM